MRMKLLLEWDIKPEQERPYFEFIVREFAPGLTHLGLQLTEAWYTAYGSGPQIHITGVAQDQAAIDHVLHSVEWDELCGRLKQYVHNFAAKVAPDKGGFQI